MLDFLASLSVMGLIEYATSCMLFFMAVWGVIHFFPHKFERGDNGPAWLILAIWIGFVGNGLNAFIWQVIGDPLKFYEVLTPETYVLIGGLLGDIVGKGLAGISIYLHFYARYAALPDEEKSQWSPLLMGYYPDKTSIAYKALRLMTFKWRETSDES